MTDRDKGSLYDEWKKRQDQLNQEESVRERARQQSQAEYNAAEQARRIRETEKGGQTLQELEQEFRQQQLDRLAEEIKNTVWRNTQGVPITLTKVSIPDVTEDNSGTYRNRSLVGVKLSYSYDDVAHWTEVERIPHPPYHDETGAGEQWTTTTNSTGKSGVQMVTQEFSFGTGYFGRWNRTLGHANTLPAEEQRKLPMGDYDKEGTPYYKGVKSYFVRKIDPVYLDKFNPMHVFPIPSYQSDFINKLYELVSPLSPDIVVPQARERVREWNATHKPPPGQQPRQGFFRRWFGRG